MNYPKYIITKQEQVIMFTPMLSHNEVTKDAVSAGFFCFMGNGLVKCFGESQSLGVKCREGTDALLIEQALRIGDFRE